jgi:type II secretory pathway pseudopilin PulG
MKHFRKYFPDIKSQAGATLVVIIIAMVVVAILGAGMLALFYTSLFNQTEAQKTAKAYYLSESGIRIAAGEFHSATAANKNQTLINLQGKTFNLPDNGGTVTLQIYPYWFYVLTAQNVNAPSINLFMPGRLPLVNSDDSSNPSTNLPAPGILKLQGQTKVGVFASASVNTTYDTSHGTLVTFATSSYFPCSTSPCNGFPYAISAGDNLYLGYVYDSVQNCHIGVGCVCDLVFDDPNDTAWIYPPVNGSIIIRQRPGAGDEYTYQSRTIDSTSTPHKFTLHNIQAVNGALPNIFIRYDDTNGNESIYGNVNKTTQIYLGKTLGVRSQSEYVN